MYGWGHNHRGQLGGVEGNKIKTPKLCEAFSELSPVQVVGGEQTMFAVTQDGKVREEEGREEKQGRKGGREGKREGVEEGVGEMKEGVSLVLLSFLPPGLCLRLRCLWPSWNWRGRERFHPHPPHLSCHERHHHQKAGLSLWREALSGHY